MDHTIIDLPAFDAVGLRCECPGGDTSAIGPLWDALFEQHAEIPGSIGVVGLSWGDGADGFSYLAGHKVAAGQGAEIAASSGLQSLSVPGSRCVSVQWQGKPDDMKAAFSDIYSRILPEQGLKMKAAGVCIEDYPPDAHDEVTRTLKAELLVQVD